MNSRDRVAPEKTEIPAVFPRIEERETERGSQKMSQVIDLMGQKFGKWEVVGFDGVRNRNAFWLCKCSCGKMKVVRASLLRFGGTKSCGCYSGEDLSGKIFGDLTVIGREGSRWLCRCTCGKQALVYAGNLRKGNTKSCGCKWHFKHGYAHTKIYAVWRSMIGRCTNASLEVYPHYGGRGIQVCEEWMKFEAFLRDMGDRPFSGAQIDRIDNNGHYSKDNCRWASRHQQMRNTRKVRNITINGVTKCLSDWAQAYGVNYNTIRKRIMTGMSPVEAITKPRVARCR